MTLCDTGPVVALVDEDDQNFAQSVGTFDSLGTEDLITTWPCLTEAMYLAGRVGGHAAQERIWAYVADGVILVHRPEQNEWQRADRDLDHLGRRNGWLFRVARD